MGYWALHGYPNLMPADCATQTADVNQAISSTANYNDYCLPLDTDGAILPDKSSLGGAHADNCIADFLKTSQSEYGNAYGETKGLGTRADWYMANYFAWKGYSNVFGMQSW